MLKLQNQVVRIRPPSWQSEMQTAFRDLPVWLIQGLGAGVLVTTVISGVDYVLTYIRKAIAVSRGRRGIA